MVRALSAIFACVVLVGVVMIGAGHVEGITAAPGLGPLLVLTVLLAAAAVALALSAATRARRAEEETRRLAQSVDLALKRISQRNDQTASSVGALADTFNREVGDMLERIARAVPEPTPETEAAAAATGNVIKLPSTARRAATRKEPAEADVDLSRLDRFDLSLQPIVDVPGNAAAAFDVFANLHLADGSEKAVRRLGDGVSARECAVFEQTLFEAAAKSVRRQVAGKAPGLSLHVAISQAMLADEPAVAAIVDALDTHPGLARGLVFVLPAHLLTGEPSSWHPAIGRISAVGGRLGVEGWPDIEHPAPVLGKGGVEFLVLPATRLLDQERVKRRAATGADIIEAAHGAGLSIVATGVGADEEAVALLDMGVVLMSGARFSGPRRLKPDQPADAPLGRRTG
jgi:EAL domain-containing protein (putative c-di-GMP-specific phosphodiesterase class I)